MSAGKEEQQIKYRLGAFERGSEEEREKIALSMGPGFPWQGSGLVNVKKTPAKPNEMEVSIKKITPENLADVIDLNRAPFLKRLAEQMNV